MLNFINKIFGTKSSNQDTVCSNLSKIERLKSIGIEDVDKFLSIIAKDEEERLLYELAFVTSRRIELISMLSDSNISKLAVNNCELGLLMKAGGEIRESGAESNGVYCWDGIEIKEVDCNE
jgi:hypothetical protein